MKTVRSMLGWWCLLLGALAAVLAHVSRGADKILYLDADRSVPMIEMELTLHDVWRATSTNVASKGPYEVTSRDLMMLASHGSLLVRTLEYGRPRAVQATNAARPSTKVRVRNLGEAVKAFGQAMQRPRLTNVRRFRLPLVWVSTALFAFGALLLAYPPLRRALLEAVRRAQNRCMFCGYSLRGLISHRCPECGSSLAREETV
jgi:hypothetical protein